jgi:hypothetical protein
MGNNNRNDVEVAKISSRSAIIVAIISAIAGGATIYFSTRITQQNSPLPTSEPYQYDLDTAPPQIFWTEFTTKLDPNGTSACSNKSITALEATGISVTSSSFDYVFGLGKDDCSVLLICADSKRARDNAATPPNTIVVACDSDYEAAKNIGRDIAEQLTAQERTQP